jgi:hypothetical protein
VEVSQIFPEPLDGVSTSAGGGAGFVGDAAGPPDDSTGAVAAQGGIDGDPSFAGGVGGTDPYSNVLG